MTATITETRSATKAMVEWQADGACRSADPETFYPVSPGGASTAQIEQAKRICASCPVRRECLEFATRTSETHGIWGGTTPEERVKARRAAAARRRHAASRSFRPAATETGKIRAS
jgi:WhiB family redox-sensing transcriptional regulator